MHRKLSLLLLLAAPCATILLAQQQGQGGGGLGEPIDQLYPGLFGSAAFGDVHPGEFTGDLSLDAIVMDAGTARLAIAPEAFDAVIDLAAVDDVAVLPGSAKDRAVTVSAAGLRIWERDYAQSTWITTTVRGAASAWGLAELVDVGDVDGASGPDLVGVAVDGTTVLLELADGSGGYTSGTSFSSYGGGVYELRLLNFVEETSGPQVDEIALFTSWGVEVYHVNGTYAGSFSWSTSTILPAVCSDGTGAAERLALVTRTQGTDKLLLLDEGGLEGPYGLGDIGVVALASDDADGDGDTELFLSIDTANEFLRIDALGGGIPSYDTAGVEATAFGDPDRDPSLNQAGIGLGDFDSDGALEALLPAQGDPSGSPAVHGTLELADVEVPGNPGLEVAPNLAKYAYSANTVEFSFATPGALIEIAQGETRALSIRVWRTPDFGESTIVGTYAAASLSMPNPGSYSLAMPAGYNLETSTDVFSLVVRQVAMDGGGVVRQGPATVSLASGSVNAPVIGNDPTIANFLQILDDDTGVPTTGGVGMGGTVPAPDPGFQPVGGGGSGS